MLLAFLALFKAAGYWLQQLQADARRPAASSTAPPTPTSTPQLPAIKLLFLISLLAAVLLIINIWQRGWRLPVIAVGLWGLVAVVAGAAYPAFVQRFQVQPAESDQGAAVHRPQHRGDESGHEPRQRRGRAVPARPARPARSCEPNTPTLQNIRLIDTEAMAPTYQKLRGAARLLPAEPARRRPLRDRRPTCSRSSSRRRELNPSGLPGNTWENRHLAYTHGYGVAFAPGSEMTPNGQPAFIDTTVDSNTAPYLSQPAIYFGENVSDYAVVHTKRSEISYSSTGQDAQVTYQGTGGVSMGSTVRRLAFALRFGEINLFTSGLITGDSRILYVRDVRARVQAPGAVPGLRQRPVPGHHRRPHEVGDRRLHDDGPVSLRRSAPTPTPSRPGAGSTTASTTCATR